MKSIVKLDPCLTVEDVEDIIRRPIIIKVNGFDDKDVDHFEEDISMAHETGQPVIPIIIDTYGGSSYGCMAMVSAMTNSHLPLATIVPSKAMSAGAILFAFGTEGYRFMDPHAYLMLHDMYQDIDGKVEDVKIEAQHSETLNNSIFRRVAKQVGLKDSYFLDLIKKSNHIDLYLSAQEARKHKLANVLKIPTLEVNVKVEFKFGA